jgi:hypothetical protein
MGSENVVEKFLIFVISAIAFIVLSAYPVMLLWNWLMPYIFELPTLNFWQAFGLSVLCNFLFTSYTGKSKD